MIFGREPAPRMTDETRDELRRLEALMLEDAEKENAA